MAATIAKCWGSDSTRVKSASRLGSQSAKAEVATWRTFVYSQITRNGDVQIVVKRDGKTVHTYSLPEEG
jgi:hypothetical protein